MRAFPYGFHYPATVTGEPEELVEAVKVNRARPVEIDIHVDISCYAVGCQPDAERLDDSIDHDVEYAGRHDK